MMFNNLAHCLSLFIRLEVSLGGESIPDRMAGIEGSEPLIIKLFAIVKDDSMWNAKPDDYVLLDEVGCPALSD